MLKALLYFLKHSWKTIYLKDLIVIKEQLEIFSLSVLETFTHNRPKNRASPAISILQMGK